MKRGQSEMVGFAIILIIVAVLILIFIAFSVKKPNTDFVESYEVESFLQSFLEVTTNCTQNYNPNYVPMKEALLMCTKSRKCYNGEDPCDIFNETAKDILKESWIINEATKTRGYSLNVTFKGEDLFSIQGSNVTVSSRGAIQKFEGDLEIKFIVYG